MAVGSHGKLDKTYLTEVLFELRYDINVSTSSVVDRFQGAIEHHFPHRENLNVNVLEFTVGQNRGWQPSSTSTDEPLDVVQYRFISQDKKKLCQLGSGIVSINHLSYESFDYFMSDVTKVLQIHAEVFDVKAYRRLGLRYINQFPLPDDPESIISWSVRKPPNFGEDKRLVSNQQQVVWQIGGLGYQSITVAYPVQNQHGDTALVLDIDHFLQFSRSAKPDFELLREWLQDAHEHIWETFVQALSPEYMKELTHGSSLGE